MSEQQTQTVKKQIMNLIYEQASQAHAERLTATSKWEQASLDGERAGLRQLLKTIEREIPGE